MIELEETIREHSVVSMVNKTFIVGTNVKETWMHSPWSERAAMRRPIESRPDARTSLFIGLPRLWLLTEILAVISPYDISSSTFEFA